MKAESQAVNRDAIADFGKRAASYRLGLHVQLS